MKEDPPVSGGYGAEIPASATMGGVVDYFIEAMGEAKSRWGKGAANKTLKITMLNANGQPLVPGREEEAVEEVVEAEAPSLFFGLGIGGGVGWATGNGEINAGTR